MAKIIEIWLQASLTAHSFISAEYWIDNQDKMRNIYLPKSKIFIFEDDESKEVRAFAAMNNDYLEAIFVAPLMQRKGIGKALLDYIKRKHQSITLTVYSKNISSIEFYKKQGFRILEERIEEATSEKELVMRYN